MYDKVRAFRAPNSKHPKTGLHKRPDTGKLQSALAALWRRTAPAGDDEGSEDE